MPPDDAASPTQAASPADPRDLGWQAGGRGTEAQRQSTNAAAQTTHNTRRSPALTRNVARPLGRTFTAAPGSLAGCPGCHPPVKPSLVPIIHFSVQSDHLHLIAEADSPAARRRGLWGLAVRTTKAINRRARRKGRVRSDRYHVRPLGSPREVRRAMTYVLLNFCKHLRAPPGVAPRSSGPWFDGWKESPPAPKEPRPVALPRTWLGAVGWCRAGGRIAFAEAPERMRLD